MPQEVYHRLREGIFVLTVAFALYILLSLFTYHHTDPGWSHTSSTQAVSNAGGKVGAYLSDIFLSFFGYWAYCLPFMFAYAAWLNMKGKDEVEEDENHWHLFTSKWIGFCLIVIAGTTVLSLWDVGQQVNLPAAAGGILGNALSHGLSNNFNRSGATVISLALFLIGFTLFSGFS